MFKKMLFIAIVFLIISCNKKEEVNIVPASIIKIDSTNKIIIDTVSIEKFIPKQAPELDSIFVKLTDYSDQFIFDMKYATTNNFLNEKVYDCGECYLRYKTIKALIAAQNDLAVKGYTFKIFDCYRPLDVQKKMWKILPGTNYVANPTKGSVHNRGGAVDLTIVDSLGVELDMGTNFDFFGPEAHHTFSNFTEDVLTNRKLLKATMEKHNFKAIYSEWWHYNFKPARFDEVSNFNWDCSQNS